MSYTFNNTMIGEPVVTVTGPNTTSTTYPYDPYTVGGAASGLTWGNLNGTSGQVYTTNGTGGASWATITSDPNLQGRTLQVNGDADITGELTVQGVKLSDRLDKIEEKLAILRPNEELEEKWDNLRALRNAYMELEAEIKEKEAMWKILKK
jgi:hypothetical protein